MCIAITPAEQVDIILRSSIGLTVCGSAGSKQSIALRAKPYLATGPLFLLDAPADIRQRAEQIALRWKGLITWHPQVSRQAAAVNSL